MHRNQHLSSQPRRRRGTSQTTPDARRGRTRRDACEVPLRPAADRDDKQERPDFPNSKTYSLTKTLIAVCLCLTTALAAQANVNVVATLPDYASLAREIGGDNVDVTVLAKPTEDPPVRRCTAQFRRQTAAGRCVDRRRRGNRGGWLPPLLQNARNPKIEVGQPGRVQASQGIRLMEVPAELSRAAGDVHAMGNPHFIGRSDYCESRRATYRERPCCRRFGPRGRLWGERKEI